MFDFTIAPISLIDDRMLSHVSVLAVFPLLPRTWPHTRLPPGDDLTLPICHPIYHDLFYATKSILP